MRCLFGVIVVAGAVVPPEKVHPKTFMESRKFVTPRDRRKKAVAKYNKVIVEAMVCTFNDKFVCLASAIAIVSANGCGQACKAREVPQII
jgi:hypothetical protein